MRSKFMRVLICYYLFLLGCCLEMGWGESGHGLPLPGTCSAPLPTALPVPPFSPDEDKFLQLLESGFWGCGMAWDMGRSLLVQLQSFYSIKLWVVTKYFIAREFLVESCVPLGVRYMFQSGGSEGNSGNIFLCF